MSIVTQPNNGSASDAKYYNVMDVAKDMTIGANETYSAYTAEACPKTGEGAPTTVFENLLGNFVFGQAPSTTNVPGAHGYYRSLVGGEPDFGFDDQLEAAHKIVSVTSARQSGNVVTGEAGGMDYITVGQTPVKVTFTIWLEGTDISCFDCCAKQSFEFAFDFKIVGSTNA